MRFLKRLFTFIPVFAVGFLLMWNWRGWNWYPVTSAVIFGLWLSLLFYLYLSSETKARSYAKLLMFITVLGYALYSFSIIHISDCGITATGLECMSKAL